MASVLFLFTAVRRGSLLGSEGLTRLSVMRAARDSER